MKLATFAWSWTVQVPDDFDEEKLEDFNKARHEAYLNVQKGMANLPTCRMTEKQLILRLALVSLICPPALAVLVAVLVELYQEKHYAPEIQKQVPCES